MTANTELKSRSIMRQCARFERCSAPICPLDLLEDERDYIRGEQKCTSPKSRRIKVGRDSELPRKGLTKSEWAASQRWERLSDTEKAHRTAKLGQVRSIYTGDLKAYSPRGIQSRQTREDPEMLVQIDRKRGSPHGNN